LTLVTLGLVLLLSACAKEATPTPAPAPAATPKPAATPAKPLKTWKNLKFQHYSVPGEDARWNVLKLWTEKIAELTNGRVTIETYPQNELVKVREMPEAAAKGIVDMYLTNEFYHFGVHPWLGWTFIPGSVDGTKWDTDYYKLMDAGIWEIQDREFAKVGLKQVFPWNGGPIFAFCMRDSYVKGPDTFPGRKVRGGGGATTELLKVLGASAVSIAGPEVIQSLSTGVIDGALTSINVGVYSWKWYEVAPYASYYPSFPMNSWNVPVIMNKALWDEFDDEVKQAFHQAYVEMQPIANELVKKDIDWALDGLAKDNKVAETYIAPDEVAQQFLTVSQKPLREWYLSKAGDTGAEILAIVDKYYGR
jgi:TRAP-type C4-dicarboxylate transport system substrate-binding protein